MTDKTAKPIFEFGIIALLGIYNLLLYINGGLAHYIHPRYNSLSLISAVLCITFALLGAFLTAKQRTGAIKPLNIMELLLLIIVTYGIVAPPSTLSAETAVKRTSATIAQGKEVIVVDNSLFSSFDYSSLNMADWVRLLDSNPVSFVDREVKLVGFVYKEPSNKGSFYRIARFTISCCAVDATPMSLLVKGTLPSEISENDWVEFVGKVQLSASNATKTYLTPISIKKVDQPQNPYVY